MEPLLIQDLDSSRTLNFGSSHNFWTDIYQYYNGGGYKYIYTNNIVKLLISYVLIIVINFLINCVEYDKILNLKSDTEHKLSNYIRLNNWFPSNVYLIICFIIYSIYLLCITIECVLTLIKFKKIKFIINHFYEINDNRIKYLTWEQIVNIIRYKNEENQSLLQNVINYNNLNEENNNNHNHNHNINNNCLYDDNQSELDNTNTYDEELNGKLFSNIESNIYKINSILCKQSNIIISIFRSRIFTVPKISKLLEWNFIYCVVDPLLSIKINPNMQKTNITESVLNQNMYDKSILDKVSITDKESLIDEESDIGLSDVERSEIKRNYIKKVNIRINLVTIINIIALPFAIIILGIYIILKYGEKFYHNPKLIYERQLDLRTKWQLKYYNETVDMFNERMEKIKIDMDLIINQYRNSILQIVYRLLIFILGSIFIILFVLTLIGGNDFANIIIFDNKSILWFLSVIGTLLLLMRNSSEKIKMSRQEKNNIIDKLRKELVSINQRMFEEDDKEYFIQLLKHIYPYKIKFIWYEIIYLLLSPYYLLLWKYEINKNHEKIFNLIEYDCNMGIVSKYSIFENINEIKRNNHMLLSIINFQNTHDFTIYNNINEDIEETNI